MSKLFRQDFVGNRFEIVKREVGFSFFFVSCGDASAIVGDAVGKLIEFLLSAGCALGVASACWLGCLFCGFVELVGGVVLRVEHCILMFHLGNGVFVDAFFFQDSFNGDGLVDGVFGEGSSHDGVGFATE